MRVSKEELKRRRARCAITKHKPYFSFTDYMNTIDSDLLNYGLSLTVLKAVERISKLKDTHKYQYRVRLNVKFILSRYLTLTKELKQTIRIEP